MRIVIERIVLKIVSGESLSVKFVLYPLFFVIVYCLTVVPVWSSCCGDWAGNCSEPSDCIGNCYQIDGSTQCPSGEAFYCVYDDCSSPACCGDEACYPSNPCGCFTPDTPVKTPEGEEAIIDLTEGDEVAVFDPETGSPSTGIIQKTLQFTRNAYYTIRTKEGKELKVTGTHPLFAVQKSETPLSFIEYLKTESLTKKLISNILH